MCKMNTIFLVLYLLFRASFAINSKYMVTNNYNNNKIKLQQQQKDSYLCQVIKQRKFEYAVQCQGQRGNSRYKEPCKPLYIPESKNCR